MEATKALRGRATLPRFGYQKYDGDMDVQRAMWALSNLIHERMHDSGVIARLSHEAFAKTFLIYGDNLLEAMQALEDERSAQR